VSGAALATVERAAAEVARVRGWTSRGEHARAAQALDAALRALAEAEAGLYAAPYVRPLYDRVVRDLDTLTGG
jgi:hypothetical protein